MGKNQNTLSHKTKIIFREINIILLPPELSFFYRKTSETLGMHCLWMWFLIVRKNVPTDLKYVCQQYFTCMCFLGFIRYNKTFIACEFRKYEHLFTHEYHIPLGRCPQGIWYSWMNKCSYFPDHHAINVYCCIYKLSYKMWHENQYLRYEKFTHWKTRNFIWISYTSMQ
jgi:hypothetical protein